MIRPITPPGTIVGHAVHRRRPLREPYVVSCATHEVTQLESTTAAPSKARHQLRAVVEDRVSQDVMEIAELLVSELVTNAVTHGSGPVVLSIDCTDTLLTVTVSDESPEHPKLQPERLMAVDGRGVRMIEALAGAWGVRPRRAGVGKEVWFSLP
jgi:anti-sigma regulatory factor (Ser/Thr protein kinase)